MRKREVVSHHPLFCICLHHLRFLLLAVSKSCADVTLVSGNNRRTIGPPLDELCTASHTQTDGYRAVILIGLGAKIPFHSEHLAFFPNTHHVDMQAS